MPGKVELPAVQRGYDLAKEVLGRVSKYPREYRFTLGDRIAERTLTVMELLVEAAYTKDKTRLPSTANKRLEQTRFMLRLSRDLGPLSNNGYEHVMKMVDELGRQIGGWQKHAQARDAKDVQEHIPADRGLLSPPWG